MSIRQILCPVDFSDASAHAVEQATALAGWYGARVTALHVDTDAEARIDALVYAEVPARTLDPAGQQRLRDRLATFCLGATAAGLDVELRVVPGHPVAGILDEAVSLSADLIVMGTHGVSGFRHLVLGSVTEKVLRRASCPVLTVPPPAHSTSTLPFKRVLCAVDFSDPSLEAVRVAGSLARQAGARLLLMHVLEWPWHEPPAPRLADLPPAQAAALAEYRRDAETTATARLESVASSAVPHGTSTSVRVGNGKPYEQLLEAARNEQADLIVLGVHGRSALDLGVFGSTTNQLVRGATCPVLTVRLATNN
jgi:nucleotide-binding universal stress UspA family protein